MGGCAGPDELLDRLSASQWTEMQIYCRTWLTPMQRADLNTALIRQNCGHWRGKIPKLGDLLIEYGKVRKRKSAAELLAEAKARAAARSKSGGA